MKVNIKAVLTICFSIILNMYSFSPEDNLKILERIRAEVTDSNVTVLVEAITKPSSSDCLKIKELGVVYSWKENHYTISFENQEYWKKIFRNDIQKNIPVEIDDLCGCATNEYFILIKKYRDYKTSYKFRFGYCSDHFGKGSFSYNGKNYYIYPTFRGFRVLNFEF